MSRPPHKTDSAVVETLDEKEPSKRKRTKDLGITFETGYADGWLYGVPAAFRDAMDIKHLSYVDKEKTKALRQHGGKAHKSDGKPEAIYCMVWTRGIPPARSYDRGDIFYRPGHIRDLEWEEALKHITHSIQVKEASPDNDQGKGGWVEYELTEFRHGKAVSTHRQKVSQAEFEELLRAGVIGSETANGRQIELLI
jgi:hypothetical protein